MDSCKWLFTTVVLVYGPLAGEATADGKFATGVLVVYHALILMVLWSYFACVLTEPGRVPDGWNPPHEEDEEAWGGALTSHESTSLSPPPAAQFTKPRCVRTAVTALMLRCPQVKQLTRRRLV